MQLWENLAREHWGYLVRICHSYLKDPFEAEDIAQEVLLKGYSHWTELADKSRVRPWLGSIARRECLSRLRRQRRRSELAPIPEAPSFVPAFDAFEIQERLLHLDKKHRTILTDFYFRELPLDEIAMHEGITHANARKRLERAREALADVYQNLQSRDRMPQEVLSLLKRPSLLWVESKVQALWRELQREMEGIQLVETDELDEVSRLQVFPTIPVFGAVAGKALRPYFTAQLLGKLKAQGERICAVDRCWRPVMRETETQLRMFHMMEICCAGETLQHQAIRVKTLLAALEGFPTERLVLTQGLDDRGSSLDVALEIRGKCLNVGECLEFAPGVVKKLCPRLEGVPIAGFAFGLDRLALIL